MGNRHPYYQEHLSFLHDGGRALARSLPRAANMLGRETLDPDVERMLEGIAYISSKISQKIDHSVDELCQLLLDILFPHYLCPLPAAAIVQIDAPEQHCTIPRGTDIFSVPVLGTSCRFSTAFEIRWTGLQLTDVSWQRAGAGMQLTLQMSGPAGVGSDSDWVRRQPPALRLHLHGEPLITRSLFQWLLTRLEGAELYDARGQLVTAVDLKVRPAGYSNDEALLSYPPGSFHGFRLLQEYYLFPEKFMFVDLEGIWEALGSSALEDLGRFSLRLNLNTDEAAGLAITRRHVRMGCTPVANLFDHSGDPVQRDPRKTDFRVRPAGPHLHYETYRVLGVTGRSPKERPVEYPVLSELDSLSNRNFCQIRRRHIDGESHTYLSFCDAEGAIPPDQTFLIDLICSNGQLPTGLGVGDISQLTGEWEHISCRNITAISRPVQAAMGEELRRRLVAHLALCQRDLATIEGLRAALDLYNYRALRDKQAARAQRLLLDGMLEGQTRFSQHLHRGIPIWGRSTELTIDESVFDTAGEVYLLGCVLNEFISLQTTINLFSEFGLRRARSQEFYRWPKRVGRQELRS